MNDELLNTAYGRDHSDKVMNVLILVEVVNAQSAFDSHWNLNALHHGLSNFSDLIRFIHKQSAETALYSFGRRAPAVEIDLIIPVLLSYLRCHCHLFRVVPAQLAHYGMFLGMKFH